MLIEIIESSFFRFIGKRLFSYFKPKKSVPNIHISVIKSNITFFKINYFWNRSIENEQINLYVSISDYFYQRHKSKHIVHGIEHNPMFEMASIKRLLTMSFLYFSSIKKTFNSCIHTRWSPSCQDIDPVLKICTKINVITIVLKLIK